MQVTAGVELPLDLHARLKDATVQRRRRGKSARDSTIRACVLEAIVEWLERQHAEPQ